MQSSSVLCVNVEMWDFGLAIAAGDETQAAEVFGTPAYMAPEQLAGKSASVRSDIYAFGLGGSFFARQNLRMGRGDRRGAGRLVAVIALLLFVESILFEHHVATSWELALLIGRCFSVQCLAPDV